jgi:hypothetical protein
MMGAERDVTLGANAHWTPGQRCWMLAFVMTKRWFRAVIAVAALVGLPQCASHPTPSHSPMGPSGAAPRGPNTVKSPAPSCDGNLEGSWVRVGCAPFDAAPSPCGAVGGAGRPMLFIDAKRNLSTGLEGAYYRSQPFPIQNCQYCAPGAPCVSISSQGRLLRYCENRDASNGNPSPCEFYDHL